MSAGRARQEDLRDPQAILRDLPARERAEFLRQCQEAVTAAHDSAGLQRLQQVLRLWSLVVAASGARRHCQEWDWPG